MQFPLSLVSIKYKHFIMFGCGETDILIIMSDQLTFCSTRWPSDQHGGVDCTQDHHLRSQHHQGYHQELSFLWDQWGWLLCLWSSYSFHLDLQHLLPHLDHGGNYLPRITNLVFLNSLLVRLLFPSCAKRPPWTTTRNTGKLQRWKTLFLSKLLSHWRHRCVSIFDT